MLWASLLLCFILDIYAEPTIWGSSVITKAAGPSPTLAYKVTSFKPNMLLDLARLTIENETCFVDNNEVGKPCSVVNTTGEFVAKINLFSVANHSTLYVSSGVPYSTYFAPNCNFPTPKQPESMPKPSIPLTRYMSGHEEVTITFAAFVGDKEYRIDLHEHETRLCSWTERQLRKGNATICKLTSCNENKERWFTGTFQRNNRNSTVYSWFSTGFKFVSVYVDWIQSGTAPDEAACPQSAPEQPTAQV